MVEANSLKRVDVVMPSFSIEWLPQLHLRKGQGLVLERSGAERKGVCAVDTAFDSQWASIKAAGVTGWNSKRSMTRHSDGQSYRQQHHEPS
jgi:hypothetical protein